MTSTRTAFQISTKIGIDPYDQNPAIIQAGVEGISITVQDLLFVSSSKPIIQLPTGEKYGSPTVWINSMSLDLANEMYRGDRCSFNMVAEDGAAIQGQVYLEPGRATDSNLQKVYDHYNVDLDEKLALCTTLTDAFGGKYGFQIIGFGPRELDEEISLIPVYRVYRAQHHQKNPQGQLPQLNEPARAAQELRPRVEQKPSSSSAGGVLSNAFDGTGAAGALGQPMPEETHTVEGAMYESEKTQLLEPKVDAGAAKYPDLPEFPKEYDQPEPSLFDRIKGWFAGHGPKEIISPCQSKYEEFGNLTSHRYTYLPENEAAAEVHGELCQECMDYLISRGEEELCENQALEAIKPIPPIGCVNARNTFYNRSEICGTDRTCESALWEQVCIACKGHYNTKEKLNCPEHQLPDLRE